MFGFGFEQRNAMVRLWAQVSHSRECQIPLTKNSRFPCKNLALLIYTLTLPTIHTDYGGRVSQMEMFSLDGLSMESLDFIWTTIAGQWNVIILVIPHCSKSQLLCYNSKRKCEITNKTPKLKGILPKWQVFVSCCSSEDLALQCQHYKLTAFVLSIG